MSSYCEVLQNTAECEHPPEMEGGPRLRTRCYRCGCLACRKCSRLTGRIRLCRDCEPES